MKKLKTTLIKHQYLAFLAFLALILINISADKPKRYKAYEEYIKQYKPVAVDHMRRYKIPASITMAQGLLESGAGKGGLTLKSNNHFGIKCHNDWTGEKVYAKDDGPNDCFRKYKKAEDSYHDHSRFLSEKPRYRFLFSLDITDYKGWARGLQKAGYATDKAYANKLIKLIEDYELYELDREGLDKKKIEKEEKRIRESASSANIYKHTPYKTGGLVYVIAQEDDTYKAIALEFGFKEKDLCKYNEVPLGFPLQKGDLVYFQKKKKKADKPYYEHVIQVGESMHSISQLYGIRVDNLYKMNKLDGEYVPAEGDVLKLR
ncbi:LysM repeat protein [Dysgonomonas sp. PH5-45]|uniref:glucosaminidase domain-containing protein n=1 Tax=unclassified Dysgonomonas TaxID=2630389 RepID=UPI0024744563|nr:MULTISPECIES: glucosaminidase domain-containing protein [unclassified Dysgonomonas]MDH6355792.1 LysM repeat protein [Dysgonomonas sp. PH5-45]MDH6388690.1 LysM repeat protein [Dysgonomonas sp. PH5-37]